MFDASVFGELINLIDKKEVDILDWLNAIYLMKKVYKSRSRKRLTRSQNHGLMQKVYTQRKIM